MATQTFSATISEWCAKIPEAAEAVFKGGAQELAHEADEILVQLIYAQPISPSGYDRSGFLRSSFLASTTAMPLLNRDYPGGKHTFDFGAIEAVIAGASLGDTIYMGMTANYAPHVFFGANGQPPKPWFTLAAQRWPAIIEAKAAEVRQAFGL